MSRIMFKSSAVPDFIIKNATMVKIKGKKYYFLPYWFCKSPDDEWYELFHLEELPKELIDTINQKRKKL